MKSHEKEVTIDDLDLLKLINEKELYIKGVLIKRR